MNEMHMNSENKNLRSVFMYQNNFIFKGNDIWKRREYKEGGLDPAKESHKEKERKATETS